MSATAENRYADSSRQRLAERLAIDPLKIEAMRRAGDLIAVREPGSGDWHYPPGSSSRKPRRGVAASSRPREAGLDETRLYDVMTSPLGLTGNRKLADLLVEGRDDEVIAAVRAAGPSRQSRGSDGAHDRDVAAHRLDLKRDDRAAGAGAAASSSDASS